MLRPDSFLSVLVIEYNFCVLSISMCVCMFCVSRHRRVHPRLMWAFSSSSPLIYCGRISQAYPELADTVKLCCRRIPQAYPELAGTVKLANQLAPRTLSLDLRLELGRVGWHTHPTFMSYGALNSGSQACLANTLTTGASPQPLHFYMLRCCV